MSEYNNSGILFPNFRKKQPKHPDMQGTATVDGKKYRLGAWRKKGSRGEFLSVAFTLDVPKEETAGTEGSQGTQGTGEVEPAETKQPEDNIPF